MTNITLKVPQKSKNAVIPAIPPSAMPSILNASRKAALGSGGAMTVVAATVENGVLENDVTRDVVEAVVVAELVGAVVVDLDDTFGTDVDDTGGTDVDDTVGTDVDVLHSA